jgi:hypothetical protein
VRVRRRSSARRGVRSIAALLGTGQHPAAQGLLSTRLADRSNALSKPPTPQTRDPWGGLFENPEDWIRGYIGGDPPLRISRNWMDAKPDLAEAVYYDAALELIGEGRR